MLLSILAVDLDPHSRVSFSHEWVLSFPLSTVDGQRIQGWYWTGRTRRTPGMVQDGP